jgi:hypothetical protein
MLVICVSPYLEYKLRPMFTVYLTAYDDNHVCSLNWW